METEIKKIEEKDGITREICVKKAENGYTVKVYTYGYKPKKKEDSEEYEEADELSKSECIMDNREYFSEEKTYVSKTNPLESDSKPLKEQISEAIKSLKV